MNRSWPFSVLTFGPEMAAGGGGRSSAAMKRAIQDEGPVWHSKKLPLLQTALPGSLAPRFQNEHPPLLTAALLN